MLILTRQKNQKVIVEVGGQRMTICVADIRGDKIRLGFEAPESFKILRQELEDSVIQENQSSTRLRPGDVP
jgi:carbon storage regulator